MPAKKKNSYGLTVLGKKANPGKKLEGFPNLTSNRFYMITLDTEEFTCLCPITGQPDFAQIELMYVPDKKIVESKSFKLYLWSFRNEGHFHEHVINLILDKFIKIIDPHWCLIKGVFNIRGGVGITITAEHCKTPAAREIYTLMKKDQ